MSLKRLSISVVILCDGAPGNFQQATAVRSVLETFGVQIYFYQLLQQQNILDFLAGNYPDCDYVIWFCYGCPSLDGEEQLIFSVVHQQDNDYTKKSNWERVNVSFTSSTITQYIYNPKGILICGAITGEKWQQSLFEVGFKAYIAPKQVDLTNNSYLLFIIGFFYHLLIHTLDYSDRKLTPQEAVIAAAGMDKQYKYGTQLFEYYAKVIS
ncbi:MAG: hypothetical protein ACRC8K_08740 [Waterburya sp.]